MVPNSPSLVNTPKQLQLFVYNRVGRRLCRGLPVAARAGRGRRQVRGRGPLGHQRHRPAVWVHVPRRLRVPIEANPGWGG